MIDRMDGTTDDNGGDRAARQTWSDDRRAALRSSRRIAWIVFGVAAAIAVLEAIALFLLTPLRTVVPYTLLFDPETGYIRAIDSPGDRTAADRAGIAPGAAPATIAAPPVAGAMPMGPRTPAIITLDPVETSTTPRSYSGSTLVADEPPVAAGSSPPPPAPANRVGAASTPPAATAGLPSSGTYVSEEAKDDDEPPQ